jgi:hypothetical protein
MTSSREPSGWAWFEAPGNAQVDPDEIALCKAFTRCFSGPDGQQVLDHLKRLMLDRRLAPSASHAELWHLEGQRAAIAHVLGMIERGGTV